MASSINKIVENRASLIHTLYMKVLCIRGKLQLVVDFGMEESSVLFFFLNEKGVTVAHQYRSLQGDVGRFFFSELDGIDVNVLYFQQDGATLHVYRANMDLLQVKFGNSLISLNETIAWPSRCDVPWGHEKQQV